MDKIEIETLLLSNKFYTIINSIDDMSDRWEQYEAVKNLSFKLSVYGYLEYYKLIEKRYTVHIDHNFSHHLLCGASYNNNSKFFKYLVNNIINKKGKVHKTEIGRSVENFIDHRNLQMIFYILKNFNYIKSFINSYYDSVEADNLGEKDFVDFLKDILYHNKKSYSRTICLL